jgi:alpha-mannosidase
LLGHSHLDAAWLWPIEESKEIFVKTAENVLKLMRKYSNFTFIQSTALYYEWLRELRPDLLKEIEERASEGR